MARLIGVDVGGTFTDIIVVDDVKGEISTAKVSTSLADRSVAILSGFADADRHPDETDVVIHGSTVATNAVIERKGAKVGLITSAGFRDIIEMGRRDRPEVYGFFHAFEPLVSRRRRIDVRERIAFDGEVLEPLDEEEVRAAGRQLLADGAEAVMVAFMHSYAHPGNEQRAAAILREFWPNPSWVTTSSDVTPELGEFERFSTAATNCYLQPLMSRYVERLASRMSENNYTAPLLIVQSNGGLMTSGEVTRHPVATVKSGPAAGVVAGTLTGKLAGFDKVITCDMGGTSFDVCLVDGGQIPVTTEGTLGFRLPIRSPAVDLVAIGAGGGSIASVDSGGILKVGPESAGAAPGPACYGLGGKLPTVTDANLVLGRLAASQPMGTRGDITLDIEAARNAVATIAEKLSLGIEETAEAILEVAANNMANAIRSVSVERGYDPREFAMVIFGGAGPLHVSSLLRATGMKVGIVPPLPGIACAVGAVSANLKYEEVYPLTQRMSVLDEKRIREIFETQEKSLRKRLKSTNVATTRVTVSRVADMQYQDQHHTIRVRLEEPISLQSIKAAFERDYLRRFGHNIAHLDPVIVNLRSVVEAEHTGVDMAKLWSSRLKGDAPKNREGIRTITFAGNPMKAPVFWRWSLKAGQEIPGPFVCEQEDTTIFVEPGFTGVVDETGNLTIRGDSATSDKPDATACESDVDPTTLAVVRGALVQIASEMDMALVQSAFSPVITEMEDRGSGLYEADSGDTIVQGPRTLPVFAATMQYAVKHLLETIKRRGETVSKGDIYIFNDPYHGGTHVQDVKLIAPYYHGEKLLFWIGVTGHWLDMGGPVPGSFVPSAQECYAEGLRIPPIKIWDKGTKREDVAEFILENVRIPHIQAGDISAMASAVHVGIDRLDSLVERYGPGRLLSSVQELRNASRSQMEAEIEAMPDGTYEFEDFIDGDGIDDKPIRVHAALTISGKTASLDFSRSSPPSTGPFNLGWNTAVSSALIAIKHIFHDVHINAGCFEPFSFNIPETTFLNAKKPRPVGAYLECVSRVLTVTLGVFGRAVPSRVPADWFGSALVTVVFGKNWSDRDFVGTFPFAGGLGAMPDGDGIVNAAPLLGLARYPILERTELRDPILFRRYELNEGSGGNGQYRGGHGTTYEIELFRKPAKVTILGDRARFAPFGANGGKSGVPTSVEFRIGGKSWQPPSITKAERVQMRAGDRVILKSPGGGGYGAPAARAVERVVDDVANGYIDTATARDVYGVVQDGKGWRRA